MLTPPSFRPCPVVLSDCLFYKLAAGRLSVRGRQPDSLLSLACRPHPATMLRGHSSRVSLLAVADQ